MKPEKAFEAVDALVQGMEPPDRIELAEGLSGSGTFPEAFGGRLVVAGVDGTAAESLSLSPEQQEKVTAASAALAEKFGVAAEDFSVLRTTAEDGSDQLTVAYTADSGIDLGNPEKDYDIKRSWNAIFNRTSVFSISSARNNKKGRKNFMVEVDGEEVDSRDGMTKAAYDAFIADAKARGVDPLPDSRQLAEQNGEVWTDTWLTGEEAGSHSARLAFVQDDEQVWSGYHEPAFDITRVLRFRPAVVIE